MASLSSLAAAAGAYAIENATRVWGLPLSELPWLDEFRQTAEDLAGEDTDEWVDDIEEGLESDWRSR